MFSPKRNLIRSLSLAAVVSLTIAACSGGGGTSSGAGTKGGGGGVAETAATLPKACSGSNPVIGVSLPDTTNPYYVSMQAGFVEKGKAAGFDVKMAIANDNDATQLSQIDSFIQQGVCAVALNPVSSGPSAAIVANLNKAGIPVFTVNVLVSQTDMDKQNAHVVQFVGADQNQGGVVMAEAVLKAFGADAKILAGIVGFPDSVTTNQRDQGFSKTLTADANAKIGPTVNSKVDPNVSLQVASDMLQGNPDMNIIFADTGPGTVGAIEAVKQLGRTGKVAVYGFCAADVVLDSVVYRGCVAQEPYDYANIVIDNIKKYIGGTAVEGNILRPLVVFSEGATVGPGLFG
jgi:ribose transport system substrate-binding protein